MAVRYYGVTAGGQVPSAVAVDASTTSRDVELAVDDANLPRAKELSRKLILDALEAIRLKVVQDDY